METKQEQRKRYYEKYKEKIKQYYQDNKEKISDAKNVLNILTPSQ